MSHESPSQKELFEACRIVFGTDIVVSQGFLDYLEPEGIRSAFRCRAAIIHPDKAIINNLPLAHCRQQFLGLQEAAEKLQIYVQKRKGRRAPQRNDADLVPPDRESFLPDRELLFGRYLYYLGIIQWRHIIQALAWQKRSRMKIGELGVKLGVLDRSEVYRILRQSTKNGSFGKAAYRLGLLTRDEVESLLQRQRNQQKRIGQFFVENELISPDELQVFLQQCRRHNLRIRMLES